MLDTLQHLIFTNWRHRRSLHVNSQENARQNRAIHIVWLGCGSSRFNRVPVKSPKSARDLTLNEVLPAYLQKPHLDLLGSYGRRHPHPSGSRGASISSKSWMDPGDISSLAWLHSSSLFLCNWVCYLSPLGFRCRRCHTASGLCPRACQQRDRIVADFR
jgi:hypothetical protein